MIQNKVADNGRKKESLSKQITFRTEKEEEDERVLKEMHTTN